MKVTLNFPNKKIDRIVILIKTLYHLWAFFLLNTFHVNNFPFNLLRKLYKKYYQERKMKRKFLLYVLGKKNEKKNVLFLL